MKKKMKRILFIFATVLAIMAGCLQALAAEETNVIKDVGDGVLQLRMVYETKKGEELPIKTGSCFLLNEKTVLTNYSLVNMTQQDQEDLVAEYGEAHEITMEDFADASKAAKNIKFYVIVRRDVKIGAEIIENLFSPEVDFATLTLQQPIQGRKSLVLGDSDSVREADTVYSLGFPRVPSMIEDVPLYTKENIDLQNGIVSKKTDVAEVPAFQHSAAVVEGTYGGPLVNERGEIIGLNSERLAISEQTNYYYAVQINEIKEYLDSFGIVYTEAPDPDDEVETGETTDILSNDLAGGNTGTGDEGTGAGTAGTDGKDVQPPTGDPALIVETEDPKLVQAIADLKAAVRVANTVTLDQYTQESADIFQAALKSAQGVLDQEKPSLEDAEDALETLEREQNGLEQKQEGPDTMMIILIAVIAVVVVILIIVIVLVARGSGKKKTSSDNTPNTNPVRTPSQPPVQPQNNQSAATVPGTDPGATGLLTPEVGATDILTGQPGVAGNAYLIRKKTGEKVTITTAHFTIGREMDKVNYCITDNTTVGRVHAVIVKNGADYAIRDQKSTNGTFVNNIRLTPGVDTVLKSGDTLRLSDEILEFVIK